MKNHNLMLSLSLAFLFLSCDGGGVSIFPLGGISNLQYDTLKFHMDSLSYWSTGPGGGSQYSFSCNNETYMQFDISFFGETNIDGQNIIGSPLIEYRIQQGDSIKYSNQISGFTNINKYHSKQRYSSGNRVYFYAGFSNAQGEGLKYTRLYSLILNCIRWHY